MEPYYTIMKLPGEQRPEFIQMLPFTPRQKDNLAAWMVARSDGEHYGKLAGVPVPEADGDLRPAQIAARINQDQVIAPQITLWNQQGSEVIQGTLLVIPIEESLIYIRPLYLRARRAHPRAQARHRRLPESDRDGGDARRGARAALPRRRRRRVPPPRRGRRSRLPARRKSQPGHAIDWRTGPSTYERALQAQRVGSFLRGVAALWCGFNQKPWFVTATARRDEHLTCGLQSQRPRAAFRCRPPTTLTPAPSSRR